MKKLAVILGLLLVGLGGVASELQPIPSLKKRVTDKTGTLRATELHALEQKLADFETQKGSQIVVVIIPTTEPEAIEQYSIRLAEAWEIGRQGVDDGVILLVAKDDRKLRIEVGYGLEGAIPDIYAKRIIENIILPRFRQGDFAGGINQGVDALMQLINGENLPTALTEKAETQGVPGWVIPLVLVLFFVLMMNTPRKYISLLFPLMLGVISWLTIGFGVAMLVLMITLIIVAGTGKNKGRGSSGSSSGSSSYSSSSYSSSSYSSSSFSGGGGSFGGGGASGGW